MISAAMVIEIHDLILITEPGLVGGHGQGPVEGALARVENRVHYQDSMTSSTLLRCMR